MAQRTTNSAVQNLLQSEWDGRADLQPYVDTATAFVDNVVACAGRKGQVLSAALLELLERWVAAHFYTKMDPSYASRTTAGASGQFVRTPKNPEPWKSGAIELDPTGCVNALFNQQRASASWLGKPLSSQVDYDQRN